MNVFWDEYLRYRRMLNEALAQLDGADFLREIDATGNTIAKILKHLAGNLTSRFTDFLDTDGEKEWRHRDSEFVLSDETDRDLVARWERAWGILERSVAGLGPADMHRTVRIRGNELRVDEALARSVAHFSFHVGQIVFLAKHFKGPAWRYLSIPPGQSERYNRNPNLEKGAGPSAGPDGDDRSR